MSIPGSPRVTTQVVGLPATVPAPQSRTGPPSPPPPSPVSSPGSGVGEEDSAITRAPTPPGSANESGPFAPHTVVLKADGRVMAFGDNDSGQLGDGSTTKRANPVEVAALGRDNAQIAAGENHTVVLKADGCVMAFGYNSHGQLGDGSTTDRRNPVP